MDNDSFKDALGKLGMSKKDFAEHMGVKQQTVNSWTSKGIPYWVEPLLTCMQDLKSCTERKESLRATATVVKADGERIKDEIKDEIRDEMRREIDELLEKTRKEQEKEVAMRREEYRAHLKVLKEKELNLLSDPDKN